jgi:PhnB protein
VTTVLAQLSVRRGRVAVEFYKEAFGAIEVYRVGGDDRNEAVVSQLQVGDGSSFWVADESPSHFNFSPETVGGGTVRMLDETHRSWRHHDHDDRYPTRDH